MKKELIVVAVTLSILVSSCVVRSIHPFYKEKDVVFKKELLGSWIDPDSSVWEFSQHTYHKNFMGPEISSNYYDVVYYEKENDTSYFYVHLFMLKGNYYLDFLPEIEENIGDKWASYHFIPTHSIARAKFLGDSSLSFFWFDEEWLGDLFEQNKVKVSHEFINGSGSWEQYILTAETAELQKFITKFGSEIDVFEKINFDSIMNIENSIDMQEAVAKKMDDSNSDVIGVSLRKMNDIE